MWAAQAAVVEAVLAVLAVVALAHRAVLAPAQVVAHRVQLPLLALRLLLWAKAHRPVPALRPVVVAPAVLAVLVLAVLAGLLVLAVLVVEPEAPLQHLLSRRSFSAAMARSTRQPQATYEPVPRSR